MNTEHSIQDTLKEYVHGLFSPLEREKTKNTVILNDVSKGDIFRSDEADEALRKVSRQLQNKIQRENEKANSYADTAAATEKYLQELRDWDEYKKLYNIQ